jgi:hypothetical protein
MEKYGKSPVLLIRRSSENARFMIAPFFVAQIRLWPNMHECLGSVYRGFGGTKLTSWSNESNVLFLFVSFGGFDPSPNEFTHVKATFGLPPV